jgi:hypothetical protein
MRTVLTVLYKFIKKYTFDGVYIYLDVIRAKVC